MATDTTIPTFQASVDAEPTYFIRFPFEGTVYCVGFDSIKELKEIVADNCVYPGEYIISFAEESMEWNERPPVAEAVADCDCQDCQCGINARLCEPSEPPTWQLYIRGVIWCGMLAMPWFCVVVALRWWAGK